MKACKEKTISATNEKKKAIVIIHKNYVKSDGIELTKILVNATPAWRERLEKASSARSVSVTRPFPTQLLGGPRRYRHSGTELCAKSSKKTHI